MVVAAPTERQSRYQRDGVIEVRGLLSADEVGSIRTAFMEQIERDRSIAHDDGLPSDDPLTRYPRLVQPHRQSGTEVGRLAARFMLDRRILDIVTELVGPALAAQSMFYFKPPKARGQALHQDNIYLRADPETCIAAWIAIDDCDAGNGGLQVVRTSHTMDLQCPEEADLTQSFTNAVVRIPDHLGPEQTTLTAGDVLFFHGSLVHGSLPNSSADRFRRSLIFHYVPQASVEVARFYQPLLNQHGEEVWIDEAVGGGPCGEGFGPDGH